MRNKKEQSDTHRYKSPFTGEFVQAHQYIAEIITERLAKKDKKELPYKYWQGDSPWAKVLVAQIKISGRLLKTYSAKAIIKALEANKWCHSLFYLVPKIKEEQSKIDNETRTKDIKTSTTTEYTHTYRKKGLLGKINGESQD